MKPNRSVPPATVVPVVSYPDVRAAAPEDYGCKTVAPWPGRLGA